MPHIGFVGLGAMGAPMAWNLDEAGYDLIVYNRSSEKMTPFSDAGVATAATPRAVASGADFVVTMVTGSRALRAVTLEESGVVAGIEPGTTVINCSTVSPEATTDVADAVSDAGGQFVDAPVSGTVGPAERGELLVLAGAGEQVLADARAVLEVFGSVKHVGEVGDGTRMKLTVNSLLGVMMEGFAEALAFAESQDLDLETTLDVLQSGAVNSTLFELKAPQVTGRDFDPRFPVELLHKDLELALSEAGSAPMPLPAVSATREAASATMALGHGEEDMLALLKHFEDVTGRTVEKN